MSSEEGFELESFAIGESRMSDWSLGSVSEPGVSESQSVASLIRQKRNRSDEDRIQKRRKRELDALLLYIEDLLGGFEIDGKTLEELDSELETLTASVLSLRGLEVQNNVDFEDSLFRLLQLCHIKTRSLLRSESVGDGARIFDVTGALHSTGKELYFLYNGLRKNSDFKLEHCRFLLEIATSLELIEDSERRLEALQNAKSIVNEVKLTSQHSKGGEISILIDLQLMDCSSDSPFQSQISDLLNQYCQFLETVGVSDEDKVDLVLKIVTVLTRRALEDHKEDSIMLLKTTLEFLNLADSTSSTQLTTAKNSVLLSLGKMSSEQDDHDGVLEYLDQISFLPESRSDHSANDAFSRFYIMKTNALIQTSKLPEALHAFDEFLDKLPQIEQIDHEIWNLFNRLVVSTSADFKNLVISISEKLIRASDFNREIIISLTEFFLTQQEWIQQILCSLLTTEEIKYTLQKRDEKQDCRSKLSKLLYSHATSVLSTDATNLALSLLQVALEYSDSSRKVQITRTLVLGYLISNKDRFKVKELIGCCRRLDPNNVLDEILLLWVASEKQEIENCRQNLQNLPNCSGFVPELLKVIYHEARNYGSHEIAMEALINLESQMPDLAIHQHLLMQLKDSDQGMNISCLQKWLQKAVLKAKEIDFQHLLNKDPAFQQVQWLFEYCFSRSLKAAKSGNCQIAVLFAESALEFHDHLKFIDQSNSCLLEALKAKFQKTIVVLVTSLIKIQQQDLNKEPKSELTEHHLTLLERISQETVIKFHKLLLLKVEVLCIMQLKQQLQEILEKNLKNLDIDSMKSISLIAKRHGLTFELWNAWIPVTQDMTSNEKASWVIKSALDDVCSDQALLGVCKCLSKHWNFDFRNTTGEEAMLTLRSKAQKLLESRIQRLKSRGAVSIAKELEETNEMLHNLTLSQDTRKSIKEEKTQMNSVPTNEDSFAKNTNLFKDWIETIVQIPGVFGTELVLNHKVEDINELCFDSE